MTIYNYGQREKTSILKITIQVMIVANQHSTQTGHRVRLFSKQPEGELRVSQPFSDRRSLTTKIDPKIPNSNTFEVQKRKLNGHSKDTIQSETELIGRENPH